MRLKELRKAKKLRQSEVAEAINCSQAVYSRYENGERTPSPDTLKALASYFGVTVDYLLGVGESNPKSAADSAQVFQQPPSHPVYYAQDASGSMQAMPDVHVTVTDPDGVTRQLMHEAAHYTGRPGQAVQPEVLAVLERDIRAQQNPQRAAKIAEAAEILQSMTDEEYAMALNILRAMKK